VQLQPQARPHYGISATPFGAAKTSVSTSLQLGHFFPLYGDPDGPHFECWTMLGAWAEQTSRIQIGALVTATPTATRSCWPTWPVPSTTSPTVGSSWDWSGWKDKDYDEYGTNSAPRAAASTTWPPRCPDQGATGQTEPAPTRDIPVLIGGKGPRKTLRLVAEYGDVWHGFTTVDSYRCRRRAGRPLRRRRAGSGRHRTVRGVENTAECAAAKVSTADRQRRGPGGLGVTLLTSAVPVRLRPERRRGAVQVAR